MKVSQIITSGAIALCLCLPAQAAKTYFTTSLSGANEFPVNASPATGWSVAVYDDVLHTLLIQVAFAGLPTPTTVAHIHAQAILNPGSTAGVAVDTPTLPGFPAGVNSFNYEVVMDLANAASYTPGFVTTYGGGTAVGAETAFITYMKTNRAYMNVHTTEFPAGEIRGFYHVPDTATTVSLFGFALGVLGLLARRSRRAL